MSEPGVGGDEMPELPEVETVRRVLEPQVRGRKIEKIVLNRLEVIAHPSAEEFERKVSGQRITGMGRRGKFLSIALDGKDTIWLHLRMTGQLLVTPPEFPKEKHTHLVFYLDDGQEIRFIDARRFGRFWLLQEGETDIFTGIEKLGPEPFAPILTGDWLQKRLGKRKKSIKECLLDQSILAGIGNIHGDEILFWARVAPGRMACSLEMKEWERLAVAIPAMLEKGIEDNRMTPEEYLAGKGKEYRNGPLLAYGREGQPCPRCSKTFCRIRLAGRSSTYCPACQNENGVDIQEK